MRSCTEMNALFHLNDWRMVDFLKIVLFLQLTLIFAIVADFLGFNLSIFRQVIGFVYLVFIPGLLLLRILKMHNLESIETILYSVGLSIAFMMLLGLFTNELLPVFGITDPMSLTYLTSVMTVSVLVLCAIAYFRDKDYSSTVSAADTGKTSLYLAFTLCILPVLSVLGANVMNLLGDNTLLIVLIVLISIIPILAMFDRFPNELYPLAIFAIAIGLVYHYSLSSTYLTGWDIQTEYYFANLVTKNAHWSSVIPSNYNGMLSVVMVGPIFSIMCDLSLVWVFKIFYPFIFALVPLGVYRVFRTQTNEKIAFLSSFFFIAIFTFYSEMLTLARQQIAEIFLLLIIFLIVDKKISNVKKSVLGVIFAFSLVTSHYGLSYLFIFSLLAVWFVLRLKNWQRRTSVISGSSAFVLLFLIFALLWYIYVSRSSILEQGLSIANNISSNLFDLLNPDKTEGLNILVSRASSPVHEVTKILYHMINFSIVIGVAATFFKFIKTKFEKQYFLFSIVNLLMLVGCITVPFFASTLNASRIYQISLLFLAPFSILGFLTVSRTLNKLIKIPRCNKKVLLKLLAVFFVVFFIFDSGLVYQLTNSNPTSLPLNNNLYTSRYNAQEIAAAAWFGTNVVKLTPVITDPFPSLLIASNIGGARMFEANSELKLVLPEPSYVFLGSYMLETGNVSATQRGASTKRLSLPIQNSSLSDSLLDSHKIYDDGGAQAYYYFG